MIESYKEHGKFFYITELQEYAKQMVQTCLFLKSEGIQCWNVCPENVMVKTFERDDCYLLKDFARPLYL